MSALQPYVDLGDRLDLTFSLLDDNSWRQRAVHEVELRDSDHVRVITAYQINLSVDRIRQFDSSVQSGDLVRLLLPFSVRPNGLLLGVDFVGVGGQPTALLLRTEAAKIQAKYLEHISGESFDTFVRSLWEGVSAYTTALWQEHQARARPRVLRLLYASRFHRLARRVERLLVACRRDLETSWRIKALVSYIRFDMETMDTEADQVDVQPDHVRAWLREIESARRALVEALGEGKDDDSASECILLAIPFHASSARQY